MADDGESPFGAVPTAQSVYPPDTGATNIELATKFLGQHRGAMTQREPDIDGVLSRMQLNTDSMTKMLDDTTAAIKASREGRVNAPLMAMAAGMLTSRGNFGNQLGEGFGRAVPAIHKDREEEDNVNFQLGQMALRRGALENLPLEKKLDYMKALQVGDLTAVRAIEQALIRAQTKTGGTDVKEAQLLQKTVKDALEEARKSVANESTEMYATNDERLAAIRERFIQNIKIMQAAGMKVPQEVVDQVTKTMQAAPSAGTATRKSYFDAPTDPAAVAATVEAGLPPPPAGYVYNSVGPKERPAIMKEQQTAFNKESKDWDETSKTQADLLTNITRAEQILTKNPKVVGPQYGLLPNSLTPNLSEDSQTLKGIFTGMQLHNIPKGQGAVSNLERELFASAGANMGVDAAANRNLMDIQKQIIARDKDRRAFFSDYFSTYRTMDGMVPAWERYISSPQGQAFKVEGSKYLPNMERQNWKEFFRNERGAPQARRDGGYIKLGNEWD